MNALASQKVADFLQDRFVATYMKVGTFQIVGDRKVGGNVASYFCLPDGAVLHAVTGPVNEHIFLSEARWAWETHRSAVTLSTDLVTGELDRFRLKQEMARGHHERFAAVLNVHRPGTQRLTSVPLPDSLPRHVNQQGQVSWLLAMRPLERVEQVYPIVWQEILRESLSGLPVATR